MAPRVTPRALPPNASQRALNARLLSSDLEAWRRPLLTKQLAVDSSGPVETISLLDGSWLSWQQRLEVARGVIPGDTTFRTYITGLDVPRFTNKALATTGPEPFPVETRPLGVPAPNDVPQLAVTAPEQSEGNITLTNPGAETGDDTGWTQTTPDLAVFENGDVPGFAAFEGTHWFYGGTNASGQYFQSLTLATIGVISGQTITLGWRQASGAAGSKAQLGLRFFDAGATVIGETFADMVAIAPALTWQARSVTAAVPADTVSVRVVMKFENVGGGQTDAYLDAITLDAADADYTSSGNDLNTWEVSPNTSSGGDSREVDTFAYGGAYGDVFRMRSETLMCWIWRSFSFGRAATFLVEFDVLVNSAEGRTYFGLGNTNGFGEGFTFTPNFIAKSSFSDLNNSAEGNVALVTFSGSGRPINQWLRFSISGARSGSVEFNITLTVRNKDTGAVLLDAAESSMQITGSEFVLKYKADATVSTRAGYYDNILVRVTAAPPTDVAETTFTSYLYRYVNDFGEASAPSLPSRTIQRTDGVVVTISTPTVVPTGIDGYGITFKQIFRSATGASGTAFRLVIEIPLGQEDFIDDLGDNELGEVLDSEEWDLPPDDLRFILALPNGIMCGASKNQLCFSVKNRPHAWPVGWRLPTDTEITGLANVDTSVVIGTLSFVYTASGNDPSAYSMSKPGAPHACRAHRSFAYLLNVGAVFAGPDGLMLVNGPTQVSNLTETIFTREQWQALDPASITGAAHDDIYFFFWDNGSAQGGYALDMKPTGFGLIELGFHATAVYVDPVEDALFMLLDSYDEPSNDVLPAPTGGFLAGVDGRTVFEFDAGEERMRYAWTGKLWLMPHPMALPWVRVRGQGFEEASVTFTADGGELHQRLLISNRPFRLPVRQDYSELQYEVIGTSRVRGVEVADDILELE